MNFEKLPKGNVNFVLGVRRGTNGLFVTGDEVECGARESSKIRTTGITTKNFCSSTESEVSKTRVRRDRSCEKKRPVLLTESSDSIVEFTREESLPDGTLRHQSVVVSGDASKRTRNVSRSRE